MDDLARVALFEAIQFANGRILNGRFSRYRVPRFRDVPEIEVVLLDRIDLPSSGAGETPPARGLRACRWRLVVLRLEAQSRTILAELQCGTSRPNRRRIQIASNAANADEVVSPRRRLPQRALQARLSLPEESFSDSSGSAALSPSESAAFVPSAVRQKHRSSSEQLCGVERTMRTRSHRCTPEN